MIALAIIAAAAATTLYICFAVKLALMLSELAPTEFWEYTIYAVAVIVLVALPVAVTIQVSA